MEENYSLHPAFISHQIDLSLQNLGVQTLDCYYLNLPEILMQFQSQEELIKELLVAFQFLEECVQEQRIRNYGIVCWNIGRKMSFSPFYMDFLELYQKVEQKLGKYHHFRFLQLPVSFGMPENFCEKYSRSSESEGKFFNKHYIELY